MIHFQWELLSDHRCRIRVSTPRSVVGTLHRLTAAMYVLGLDVVSGNVRSEERDGVIHTEDDFVLESTRTSDPHISINESTARLGELMETVLSPEMNVNSLLERYHASYPHPGDLFRAAHKLEFLEPAPQNLTRLHIQAPDRRGLLLHITRMIAAMGINIMHAMILTTSDGLADDSIDMQFQDAPLTKAHSDELVRRLEQGPALRS
ncbi:MAG: hypothetical protein KDK39_13600 [Leptospiraceae bacterium]|nr:hypothetical protein [Leptospiraceae bacterium]